MRHGKAGDPTGAADIDRPLIPRGRRDAARTGQWLHAHVSPIDYVLCSTSRRTRETLAATTITAPTEFQESVYRATTDTLVGLIHLIHARVTTVLLIGHSPGAPQTAWELAGNRDAPQAQELARRFPTSAVAVLQFDRPWTDVDSGIARLTDLYIPGDAVRAINSF